MADDSEQTREDPARLSLSGVPETMLWPLWNRAAEMRRQDRLIEDPMAAGLVARITYDFAGRFGRPSVFHPIRARVSDDLIRAFLLRQPHKASVVVLGEGLETQFWRLGAPDVTWSSVDLPEAIAVRQRLLPHHPAVHHVACSALDPAWMDAVPAVPAPFISAAGLLMYFQDEEVRTLLARIATRFPGGEIFFDTITPPISRRTQRGWQITRHYTAPPMPWGIAIDALPGFVGAIPGIELLSVQSYADPFPQRTRLYSLLSRIGPLRRRFAGGLVHLRIKDAPGNRAG
ncbi:class I SAM-dependent methyltransferase [Phreatobacter sp.]|uniref:class I SAM-dependent methyltransferase n=1 Tax=Phreatobacter sp. TaxID=1966341 RepID=UPI0025EB0A2A|nr:class I SAM-dependent methyltransferase [Phreatobacter sp.]